MVEQGNNFFGGWEKEKGTMKWWGVRYHQQVLDLSQSASIL